jgi:hypothetical protein
MRLRIAIAAAWVGVLAHAQSMPATGRDVLQAMHDGYAGKWYSTLTLVQKTTRRTADGRDSVATWYESVRYTAEHGAQLRIDIGSPTLGNGVLYTADSLWAFRDGKLAVTRAGGNALIPLIESVYMQPVDRTVRELAATGVDFTRATVKGRWLDHDVWIVGASSAADTVSPQVWVDVATKVVVRSIFAPVPGRPMMDARFQKYVALAGGWLATQCVFFVDGKFSQGEDYQDWKANVPLAPALFDIATFTTAPHWANKR